MERYKDASLKAEERAEDLLSRMTLEEKIAQMDMIRGVELATKVHEAHFCAVDPESDFYWDKVEKSFGTKGMGFVHDVYSTPSVLNKLQRYLVEKTRLGIPCIFTGEALHGLSYPGAMIFPMPINLGAAFHPELTEQIGHAIAAETRSLGIHEILAPNLDLAREPRWGRVEETFGEDTYLSSQMAYAIITGEQGEDISAEDRVVAEPKHYCVHGIPEAGTNCSPARVGQREVETAYLPVFEAGIKQAGAYNAMASYNCIDGEAVICSEHYLRKVLKERYELKGYVRADFGAVSRLRHTHHMTASNKESIKLAVENGLDVQGFDFPNEEWQGTLQELVEEGSLAIGVIDDAVYRILLVKFELGLFEKPYTDEKRYREVVRCQKHKDLSYKAAQESIVMLENKNQVLPLTRETGSIAVIGPSSLRQREGSYSSVPYGYRLNSLYEEISSRVGEGCRVRQVDGCGITEQDVELIPKSWYPGGITMEYFNNNCFAGEPAGIDRAEWIKFNWILAKPHRGLEFNGYTVRMTARLKVDTRELTGTDHFLGRLVFTTGDSVRVFVDGNCLIDSWGDHKMRLPFCTFEFVHGEEHDLVIEFYCDVNGHDLMFCVDHHTDDFTEALEAAKSSDVVVLVCGDNKVTSGEGMDRSELTLYGRQRELIREVGGLGKPVILVLENGKPVDLTEEKESMDAILVAWFGGEFGAKAIVDVLFGSISPSGRLPISFPKGVGYLPCYYSMLPGGSPNYLEGEKRELYPFGYGLSYTTFEYGNLCIEKLGRYEYRVTAEVTNTGTMGADEVAQLYVGDVCSSIVTPDLLLKGFRRLHLEQGECRQVEFMLDFDSFKLLNRRFHWVVEPGEFRICVGAGFRDIRLEGIIMID